MPAPRSVCVCLKWVATRVEIDPLSGAVATDRRFAGVSPADEAALEYGLRLGAVTAVTVGPDAARQALYDALAAGATRGVHVAVEAMPSSPDVARAMAATCAHADLVLCGDYSLDRGSGSVPSFLAHELGLPQALGLVGIAEADPDTDEPGRLEVVRRLDQGRRELLAIDGPAVLSVEGGLPLRRAGLRSLLDARRTVIETLAAPEPREPSRPSTIARYRPPTHVVAPPTGNTRHRILQLSGADSETSPAQHLELDPEPAAAAIVEQLRHWGHLDR